MVVSISVRLSSKNVLCRTQEKLSSRPHAEQASCGGSAVKRLLEEAVRAVGGAPPTDAEAVMPLPSEMHALLQCAHRPGKACCRS